MKDLSNIDIGRYHVIERLGMGGMAVVYKAVDTSLKRNVALKVIRTEEFGPAALGRLRKRFEREAVAQAKFMHPNIVPVLDYGEYEGAPYLVMPYFAGGTLKDRIGSRWGVDEAARLLTQVAEGLAYAHEKGVLHRDVKPGNVLMTLEGLPLLSDFGIAKVLDNTLENGTQLTGTGVGIGTPEYMSPEQCRGEEVDTRTDIYALGVVFYELLTGRRPFKGNTPMGVVFKQINDPLPDPRQYAPDLPEEAISVLNRTMAKKPDKRYAAMQELALALKALGESQIEPAVKAKPGTAATAAEAAAIETETQDKFLPREERGVLQGLRPDGRLSATENLPKAETGKPWWKHWITLAGISVIVLGGGMFAFLGGVGLSAIRLDSSPEPTTTTTRKATQAVTATVAHTATIEATATELFTATPTPTPTPALLMLDNAAKIGAVEMLPMDDAVSALSFSPNGQKLAVGHLTGIVNWLDIESKEVLQSHRFSGVPVNDVLFSQDGEKLAVAFENLQVLVYDVKNGSVIASLDHESPVVDLHFSADGGTLEFACRNGRLYEWNMSEVSASTKAITMPGNLMHAAFSNISGEIAGVAHVNYEEKGANAITGGGTYEYVHRSAQFLYYGWSSGLVKSEVLDVEYSRYFQSENWSGQDSRYGESYNEETHLAYINHDHELDITFSPDGSLVVAGSYDNYGDERRIFYRLSPINDYDMKEFGETCFGGEISSLAFSPDGSLLASDCGSEVALWDVAGKEKLVELQGHGNEVKKIKFSPDGTLMVSGDAQGNLIYWRVIE